MWYNFSQARFGFSIESIKWGEFFKSKTISIFMQNSVIGEFGHFSYLNLKFVLLFNVLMVSV